MYMQVGIEPVSEEVRHQLRHRMQPELQRNVRENCLRRLCAFACGAEFDPGAEELKDALGKEGEVEEDSSLRPMRVWLEGDGDLAVAG